MKKPNQVIYKTHHTNKYSEYGNGNIKNFVKSETTMGKLIYCKVDETTLNHSHRCQQNICNYSSKLYPQFQLLMHVRGDEFW
jgi:hypothetical protein